MLQWLYTYVVNVCSQYFICFFQIYVTSVFIWMLHMFHTYVASVFIWMLRTWCNGFQVFHLFVFASVSDSFFKCFIYLRTYIANASSACFKSRSGVAHVAMASVAAGQWLARGLRLQPCAFLTRRASSSPLPPFPSLPSISLRQFELDRKPYPMSTQTPGRWWPGWAGGGAMLA
jgi:hypothetical protein